MKGKIIISSFIVVLAVIAIFVGYLYFAPATLQAEINSLPTDVQQSVNIQQGASAQFTLSLRNMAGFRPMAKGVYGKLELPNGFFMESSLDSDTGKILFDGLIPPGDASHVGVTICAESNVESGTYYAKFTFWGKNVRTSEIDIEICCF